VERCCRGGHPVADRVLKGSHVCGTTTPTILVHMHIRDKLIWSHLHAQHVLYKCKQLLGFKRFLQVIEALPAIMITGTSRLLYSPIHSARKIALVHSLDPICFYVRHKMLYPAATCLLQQSEKKCDNHLENSASTGQPPKIWRENHRPSVQSQHPLPVLSSHSVRVSLISSAT